MKVSGQHHAMATFFLAKNPNTCTVGGWAGPGAGPDIIWSREKFLVATGTETPVRVACSRLLFTNVLSYLWSSLIVRYKVSQMCCVQQELFCCWSLSG